TKPLMFSYAVRERVRPRYLYSRVFSCRLGMRRRPRRPPAETIRHHPHGPLGCPKPQRGACAMTESSKPHLIYLALPPSIVAEVDRRADRELLSRASWLRLLIARAVRGEPAAAA